MTKREHEETMRALKKTRAKATVSKQAALAYLQKLGAVDAEGKLTPEYQQTKAA